MNNSRQVKVLKKLSNDLNSLKIEWALGGSLLLHFEGIDVVCDDIDLLVDIDDHKSLLKYLTKYEYTYQEANPKYRTEHFYSLTIDGIDIDVMVGFKINNNESVYTFPFKVSSSIEIDNSIVHLSSIKEWRKAYSIMGRTLKVEMIDKHLEERKQKEVY